MPACGSTGAALAAPSRWISWSQRTSPPAQKARSPAPVITITPDFGIAGGCCDGVAHFRQRVAREGVHHVGAVDGDPGCAAHPVVLLVEDIGELWHKLPQSRAITRHNSLDN